MKKRFNFWGFESTFLDVKEGTISLVVDDHLTLNENVLRDIFVGPWLLAPRRESCTTLGLAVPSVRTG